MLTQDLFKDPRPRLMVVNGPDNLADLVRKRYPQFDIAVSRSYLEGIATMDQASTKGLLVGIDPGMRKLKEAVSGLRKAAGEKTLLLLCCPPSGEPAAREMLSAGADDYLIYPPSPEELDKALGLEEIPMPPEVSHAPSGPTWEELNSLTGMLSEIGTDRQSMLEKLCQLIARSMRVQSVRVSIDRDQAHEGEPRFEPTLAELITREGKTLGQILVGPRERSPFATAEVEKLRHFSRIIGNMIQVAEQQQQWQSLAMMDEATGLPNRRYLTQALEQILQRAGRERFTVTLLIFDLDGFKHFNDTYGHDAGDEVLRETSQLFRRTCRQQDIVARYAGDEFVVVFWEPHGPRVLGSQHPTDVFSVLRRFKKALRSHEFPKLGPQAVGHITISGGLATFPWDGKTVDELIGSADQALLQAKRDGKNRIYLIGAEGRSIEEPRNTISDM
jgi:diguanylate cyclase (GGDEF)-like protein